MAVAAILDFQNFEFFLARQGPWI